MSLFWLKPEDGHFNEEGIKVMTEIIFPYINKKL